MTNYNNNPYKTARVFHVQSILILLLLVTTLIEAVFEDDTVFLDCLDKQSTTLNPTTDLAYTQRNSSFQTVFDALAWNMRFQSPKYRKPLVIVTANHESNVRATLFCCKRHSLQLRIRSGGHDMEGASYVSDVPFVILDMLNMRSVKVIVEDETAFVQSGAVLGEVYYAIAQKSPVHAFPGGVCPTVGVAGHFSGGGYGNLMREYGLSTDQVVDALLMDVEGRVLNRDSMGEDVFWAIRGGGAASFGIVLEWKVKLVQVPPLVTVFRVRRSPEDNVLETVYKWQVIAPSLPKRVFIRLQFVVLKAELQILFIGLFLGSPAELLDVLDKEFPELRLTNEECKQMSWVNSTLFWDAVQPKATVQYLISRKYEKVSRKVKSDFVIVPIPRQGIEEMCKELMDMEGLVMEWNPYGGRMNEIPAEEIAYPYRAGILYNIEYDFKWFVAGNEVDEYHVEWSRKLYEFMTPYVSMLPRKAFFNYRDYDIGINHGERVDVDAISFGIDYYGINFPRLVKVKRSIDPDNFFRYEQSIPPITL